jgi:hypothetical protein
MSFSTKIARGLAVLGMAAAALLATTALPGAAPAAEAAPYYKLVGLGSNKCVDIRSEDAAAGARAQLWQCYGSPNQRFTLLKVGTMSTGRPYFRIVNQKAPYLCLEVRGSSRANGAQVDQIGCSQDGNQFWYWGTPHRGVSLPLVNLDSGKCLDVNGGSTANGARVQQWDCNASNAQMWKTVE